MLDRFDQAFGAFLEDDFRAADGEFVSLAPHGFNEDGQMQFTTSRDHEAVGPSSIFHPQGDISLQLSVQAFSQLATGDKLTFSSGKGAVVDAESHAHGGRFH